jgi:glycosyltransferase involved in cell wall biosynthesis
VVALVAARNEADRVHDTVRSLATIPQISIVVVADDGSTDATAAGARDAGATVLRASRRMGKGGALEGALKRLSPADAWVLADADLEETAGELEPVLLAVLEGRADLAIALPPPQAGGGLGLVKWFAGRAILRQCGFRSQAPLSGQRALTAAALERCRPLASGFGVETAMTIDAVRAGLRVVEVPVDVRHRSTGRGPRGFAHRGRQGFDILRAVISRRRR